MKKLLFAFYLLVILFNSCNTSKKSVENFPARSLDYVQFYHQDQPYVTKDETDLSPIVAEEKTKVIVSEKELEPFSNAFADKKIKADKTPTQNISPQATNQSANTQKPVKHQDINTKSSDKLFLFFTALAGVVLGLLLIPFQSFSRKMALYAFDNRRKAVYIIAASHIGLGLIALVLGKNLFDFGLRTTALTTQTLAGLACASVILYPIRKVKNGFFKPTFFKQKLFTLLVLLSGYGLIANTGIRSAQNPNYSPAITSFYQGFNHFFPEEKVQKLSDDTITENNKSENDSHGYKVGLSVLLILMALILLFLIFILACGLACSEMAALAALVGVGGFVLIIYLTVILWRRIWKK